MTNPGQIVRVRGRANSRASVYEANAWAQAYTSGLFDGNGTQQNTSANMSVLVGGSTTKPDVVLAQNPAGYKIALDLVGQQLLTLTTPASNSRISAIVAYTDDISINGSDTSTTGSPSSCGLIIVNGTSAATPNAPTDAQIRSAITADGATGSQASYGIIATVPIASNTTTITNSMIVNNSSALSKNGMVKANNIDLTKSIDANGWTVYDYGNWKKAVKAINKPAGALASGASVYRSVGLGPEKCSNLSNAQFQLSFVSSVTGSDSSVGSNAMTIPSKIHFASGNNSLSIVYTNAYNASVDSGAGTFYVEVTF